MGVTGASVDQLPAATISTMGSGGGNHVIRVTGCLTLCISAPEKEHHTIKSVYVYCVLCSVYYVLCAQSVEV